jgi:hypothetical protein
MVKKIEMSIANNQDRMITSLLLFLPVFPLGSFHTKYPQSDSDGH